MFLNNILVKPVRAPHPLKLTQAKEFQAALVAPCRLSGKSFLMRARDNGLAGARLGLIAGRKAARRAVDRNRAKRLAREAFRAVRPALPPVDLVLQLKHNLRNCGNAEIRRELDRLIRDSAARFGSASAPHASPVPLVPPMPQTAD